MFRIQPIACWLMASAICATLSGRVANAEDVRVEAALTEPTELDFFDLPLADVLSYISDLHGIPVSLNEHALYDEGILTDDLVNVTFVEPIPLSAALDLMLPPLELTWLVENDVLHVTTLTDSQERQQLRVYDVDEIINGSGMEARAYDEASLIEFITSTVEPESWSDAGGYGSARTFDGLLVVRQDYQTHRQLTEFLQQIETAIRERGAADRRQTGDELETVMYRVYAPDTLEADVHEDAQNVFGHDDLYGLGYDTSQGLGMGYQGFLGDDAPSVTSDEQLPLNAESIQVARSQLEHERRLRFSAELAALIPEFIAPESWGTTDGSGLIRALPGLLIVKHHPDVQSEVRTLLEPVLAPRVPRQFGFVTPEFDSFGMDSGLYRLNPTTPTE